MRERLFYTDKEYREDEDGYRELYVYVPMLDEWMTIDQFKFEKTCYDDAMDDADRDDYEHGSW